MAGPARSLRQQDGSVTSAIGVAKPWPLSKSQLAEDGRRRHFDQRIDQKGAARLETAAAASMRSPTPRMRQALPTRQTGTSAPSFRAAAMISSSRPSMPAMLQKTMHRGGGIGRTAADAGGNRQVLDQMHGDGRQVFSARHGNGLHGFIGPGDDVAGRCRKCGGKGTFGGDVECGRPAKRSAQSPTSAKATIESRS